MGSVGSCEILLKIQHARARAHDQPPVVLMDVYVRMLNLLKLAIRCSRWCFIYVTLGM